MSTLTEKQILTRARSKSLESVKNLNFWGSTLADISIVRQLINVEVLSLSVNNISSLKDFAFCPRLKELYLRRNCINDISDIGFLKKLPKLRVLWLSDNPCASCDNYRQTILKNLPRLTRLDNVAVEEEETATAQDQGDEVSTPDDLPDHPDLGDTIASTMGSTRASYDSKQNTARDPGDQRVPSIDPEPTDITRVSLVDETNKLRAELGIKPLVLGDAKSLPVAVKTGTDSRSSSTSPRPIDNRNANILTAVLALVKELDQTSLEEVKTEVERRLAECDNEQEAEEEPSNHEPMIQEVIIVE